jgi:FAD/FMN-containing dehydrogenase
MENQDMSIATFTPTSGLAVITPGQAAYDKLRAGWNLAIDHRPTVIALPSTESQVADAVRLAAERNLPIAVQATGHGQAMPAADAMLVITTRLDQLEVDPAARTARIDAGVKWERVIPEAARYGLAPLVGSSPDVSAVGYLTGGGLPVLSRQFGVASDRIRSFRIVTADGQVRGVSPTQLPDLFWAVRGGKGNFGIVTSVTIDLLPIATIYGGNFTFPGERAREVMHTWLEWTRYIGQEMSTSVALVAVPGVESEAEEFLVQVRIAFIGTVLDGDRLVAPLRDLGPIHDTVGEMPYTNIGDIHADPPASMPVREWGTLLRDLDGATLDGIVDFFARRDDSPPGVLEIRLLGGAIADDGGVPGAIGHRDAAFTLLHAILAPPGCPDVLPDQTARLERAIASQDMQVTYPNLLSSGAGDPDHVRRAYEPDDYTMLGALKHAWDPGNLFRINHNIPPASAV